MEVAFVIQRYGKEIVGGAESHARQIAERLARECSWRVHVFTTTAKDYFSWAPHYPEGIESLNGVLVHRFHVEKKRNIRWFNLVSRLLIPAIKLFPKNLPLVGKLRMATEKFWYHLQGPVCPKLLQDLSEQEKYFQKIFFFTYLYYPTLFGLPKFVNKAVLIPTIHDEPAFYFSHTHLLLQRAQRIFANTEVEKDFIQKHYPDLEEKKFEVVGLGFDDPSSQPILLGEGRKINDHPIPERYLLYLGRIGYGKRVDELVAFFLAYLKSFPYSDAHLVLAGKCEKGFPSTPHPRIVYLDVVSEENKKWLVTQATCVVNPSSLESLSMLALEAMASKIPLLVNQASSVLAYYAKQTPTVFAYSSQHEFVRLVNEILHKNWHEDGELQAQLLETRTWSMQRYSWSSVLRHYQTCVEN